MPFEYSCFISYRHGQRDLAKRIIDDLEEALGNELEVMNVKGCFVDRTRLQPGYIFDECLATALCKSACMVVVYMPAYFDLNNSYCAREYKAMEKLEKQRLQALGTTTDRQRGLIIPIIFRGQDSLPKEIKDRRQCSYDFVKFTLADLRMSYHPDYAPKITKIAEYIAERYRALNSLPNDPCKDCDTFRLPTLGKIRPWLNKVKGRPSPFPMREAKL